MGGDDIGDSGGPPGLDGVRVLIVEDEAVVAFDLEFSLRDLGCTALPPVASIAEALALLEAERPDVALLDVRLRDGPSTAVAERLSNLGVPYILVTGYDDGQIAEPLLRAAPRLAKPYQMAELQGVLAQVLGRR